MKKGSLLLLDIQLVSCESLNQVEYSSSHVGSILESSLYTSQIIDLVACNFTEEEVKVAFITQETGFIISVSWVDYLVSSILFNQHPPVRVYNIQHSALLVIQAVMLQV